MKIKNWSPWDLFYLAATGYGPSLIKYLNNNNNLKIVYNTEQWKWWRRKAA